MAMQGQASNAPQGAKIQSLTEDGVNLVQRLHQILNGLESINDKLNGSSPRSIPLPPQQIMRSANPFLIGTIDVFNAATPEPQPSARRHMDKAHQLVGLISDEMQRIDARL
jgi:hypothetical protein